MSSTQTTSMGPHDYPAKLTIDYPDRQLNRLTSFFRIFVIIPIAIVMALLVGIPGSSSFHATEPMRSGIAASIFLPLILMILFRTKYPKWWFDWNLALSRFSYRVSTFFLLMRDEYPSTDEEQAVHLELWCTLMFKSSLAEACL